MEYTFAKKARPVPFATVFSQMVDKWSQIMRRLSGADGDV